MSKPLSWQDTLFLFKQDIHLHHRLHPKARRPRLFAKGLWVLGVQRLCSYYHSQRQAKTPWHLGLFAAAAVSSLGIFMIEVCCKCQLLGDTRLKGAAYLSDKGEIIFAPEEMGDGCIIHHQVTLGRDLVHWGRPRLGNNVWIGSNCVIYGAITLGDGATVLPNSVLARSIPAGAVVQGNPARPVTKAANHRQLRQNNPAAFTLGFTPVGEEFPHV